MLAVLALAASLLVALLAVRGAPFTDDEQTYRFQVSLLSDGLLSAPAPPVESAFHGTFLVFRDGAWSGVYPWGHVALLVVGGWLGSLHVFPHLAAPAAVLLTERLGRALFPDDEHAPLIGAGLVAFSPFLAFTSATLHNATSSILVATGGALCLVRAALRSRFGWALLAGLIFGFGLHVRPYNAVLEGAAMGVTALVVTLGRRRSPLPLCLGFAAGLIPFVALQLFIDQTITNDPLVLPATLTPGGRMFGFGVDDMVLRIPHTPLLAFGKIGTNFLRLVYWIGGSALVLPALLLPLLGFSRSRRDHLLYLPALALFAGYYFFLMSPVYDTGPVYYLDTLPFFALLLARTFGALAARTSARAVTSYVVAALGIAFASFWNIQGIAAKRISDAVREPYRAVAEADIHHAIVFWPHWQEQGRVSWVWQPRPPRYDLSDDVLYAFDIPDKAALRRAFPDRPLYAIRFSHGRASVEEVP